MSTESVERYLDEDGRLAALVIRNKSTQEGIFFFTPEQQSQQLGLMRRPQGYRVIPHEHVHQSRTIDDTNEVLFVRRGKIEVSLFDRNRVQYAQFRVGALEAVLLGASGHGVLFLEDSEVIEVKQGPYISVDDKERFIPTGRAD